MKMLSVLLSCLTMLGCACAPPPPPTDCREILTPVPPEMIEQAERILRDSSNSASVPLDK